MRKSFCLILFTGLFILCSLYMNTQLHAVDTTETFAQGVLTDFEGYASYNFHNGGSGFGFEILIGGGIVTDMLSYYLTAGVSSDNTAANEGGGLGIGLIFTMFQNEKFAIDLLPTFSFDPNHSVGSMTFTNFKSYTYGADIELNFMMLKQFQPYVIFGFSRSFRNSGDNYFQIQNHVDGSNMITIGGVDVNFTRRSHVNTGNPGYWFCFTDKRGP